jgi:hypothetical protein
MPEADGSVGGSRSGRGPKRSEEWSGVCEERWDSRVGVEGGREIFLA